MTEQLNAEKFVREAIPELMELSFGCEVIGGAFSKPMIYKFYGVDTSKYGRGEDGHHLVYKDRAGGSFQSDCIRTSKIIGHPIALHHWLSVLGDFGPFMYSPTGHLLVNYKLTETEDTVMKFNTTTGQPATQADFKAFNDIVNL